MVRRNEHHSHTASPDGGNLDPHCASVRYVTSTMYKLWMNYGRIETTSKHAEVLHLAIRIAMPARY